VHIIGPLVLLCKG